MTKISSPSLIQVQRCADCPFMDAKISDGGLAIFVCNCPGQEPGEVLDRIAVRTRPDWCPLLHRDILICADHG